MKEGIYTDEILHYDIVIEELCERTELSEEICKKVYDAVANILIELNIMDAK